MMGSKQPSDLRSDIFLDAEEEHSELDCWICQLFDRQDGEVAREKKEEMDTLLLL